MWGILLILIIQSKVPNECTLFYSPWLNQYHPMQMEIFCQKNGLTELQNVMHNKSFFVRHIYSRILKTILEPPSVGDKIFRHGFSKLNVHKNILLTFYYHKRCMLMILVYRIHNILPITNLFWYRIRQCLLLFGQN